MAPTVLDIRCNLHLYKGEKYYVAECQRFRITTQGKTANEALDNFNQALGLCLSDPEWLAFYRVSSTRKPTGVRRGKQAAQTLGA